MDKIVHNCKWETFPPFMNSSWSVASFQYPVISDKDNVKIKTVTSLQWERCLPHQEGKVLGIVFPHWDCARVKSLNSCSSLISLVPVDVVAEVAEVADRIAEVAEPEVEEVAEVSSALAPEVSQAKLVKMKMMTKRALKSQQTKVTLLLRPSWQQYVAAPVIQPSCGETQQKQQLIIVRTGFLQPHPFLPRPLPPCRRARPRAARPRPRTARPRSRTARLRLAAKTQAPLLSPHSFLTLPDCLFKYCDHCH